MKDWFILMFRKKGINPPGEGKITSNVRSLWVEFLRRSISLRNLVSFTSNLPNSFNTEHGSLPTSSRKAWPNISTQRRHRPNSEFAEVPLHITGIIDLDVDSAADNVTGSSEELLVAATMKDKKDRISSVNGGKIYSHLFKQRRSNKDEGGMPKHAMDSCFIHAGIAPVVCVRSCPITRKG